MQSDTTDKSIREAFRRTVLAERISRNPDERFIEELGIASGSVRIDIALLGEGIHGYEVKSDRDTLLRLPNQAKVYSEVLDTVTLIVGKSHLFEAVHLVPEWWGIILAKEDLGLGKISFYTIRECEKNPSRNKAKFASFLWRNEALSLLEELGEAKGFRTKNRSALYSKLASVTEENFLKEKVRQILWTRFDLQPEAQCRIGVG